jgi:hypothetical protein
MNYQKKAYQKKTTKKVTADGNYKKHQDKIDEQLAELQDFLKDHAERQEQNPKNWGYTGDLANVSGQLEELLDTFAS